MIMSNIWVTTDWHAIEIDERTGRKSISNSFLKLTRKAEKLVQQNDIILCLGDIAFRGQDDIVNGQADEELSPFGDMIRNMPGYKILVKGNHDGLDNQEYLKVGFQEVGTAATLGDFLFTHKPYPVSNDQVNVHGHTHHEHYIGLDDGKHIAIPPTEKSNDPPLLLLGDVLEQAKQKRMKEPMRTVQHLKDADREFCHKLATDSDYLKEVISLEDSYEAVVTNGLNESIIIPQDNFILNYDKWDYGMPLWITGASGDGKSTLANKLAKDNNAIVVSTDYVLMYIGFTPEEFENKIQKLSNEYGLNLENNMLATEYINTHPNLPRGLRDPKTKTYNRNKTVPEMVTYFEWVYNKIRTDTKYRNQKYIIEGCEISHMDPDFFVDKPIIIMGGSRIQSFYRRIKRDNPQNPKALLKSLIKHVRKYPIQNTILDSDKEKFRNNLSKTVLTIDESISPARIPGLGHHYIHPNAVQASMMLATMMDDGMDPTRDSDILETLNPDEVDINKTIDESISITPYDIVMGQVMNENIFLNDDDLYYNKDKFDSGEINLCFITGLSGSGKSTMGMHMRDKTIEHYELDDLWCVADHFSMANLKEYGDLIYSFFKGSGKKYYITLEYLKKNNVSEFDYEYKLFPDFVHYAMKYAKLHKDKKFILEGIWLFCAEDRRWFNPKEFDDYAVYIKNTSVIVSMIRGAKRDASNFVPSERPREFVRTITKNFKRYFIDEKLLSEFRSYFIKKIKETHKLNESMGVPIDEANIVIGKDISIRFENLPKKIQYGYFQICREKYGWDEKRARGEYDRKVISSALANPASGVDGFSVLGNERVLSAIQHSIEQYDSSRDQAILASENIVEAYNAVNRMEVEKAIGLIQSIPTDENEQMEYIKENKLAVILNSLKALQTQFAILVSIIEDRKVDDIIVNRYVEELGITQDTIVNIITNSVYTPTNNPDEVRAVLNARASYNRTITSILQTALEMNYQFLGLSKDEAQIMINQIGKSDNDRNKVMSIIRERLRDPEVIQKAKRSYGFDLSEFNGGKIIYAPEAIDLQKFGNLEYMFQSAMEYDMVVISHGNISAKEITDNQQRIKEQAQKTIKDKLDAIGDIKRQIDSEYNRAGSNMSPEEQRIMGSIVNEIKEYEHLTNRIGNRVMEYESYLYTLHALGGDSALQSSDYLALKSQHDEDAENIESYNQKILDILDEIHYVDSKYAETAERIKALHRYRMELEKQVVKINSYVNRSGGDTIKLFRHKRYRKHLRWVCMPVTTPGGVTCTDVNTLLRQLIKEGYKKIKLFSCNPGHYELDRDIKNTPGVTINMGTNVVILESADEYAKIDSILESAEHQLITFCDQNQIDYNDTSYLNECTTFIISNTSEVINEGLITNAWESIKTFIKKFIGFIISLFRKMISFIRAMINKIKSFFSNARSDFKNISDPVEVHYMMIENAQFVNKQNKSWDMIEREVLLSCNRISNKIKELEQANLRNAKMLEQYADQQAKSIDEAVLSPMGLRKEDPKKKKKKLSKPDDPPKHTPGDDWDLVDKDHMVLPPDIQILEPHVSENASMISHLPNQISDESVTLYHGSPSKFKKVRELRVESEEITNPNDTLSNKAVKLSFYDKNVKVGEASISAIDTNNGFLYDFEVFKQYRGRGYGRRIMQYIMSHYSVTDLTVDSSNMVAINLYKSFGFKRKQSYYDKVNKEKLEWYQRLPNTINETIPDIQILEPHVSENASVSIVSLHGGFADDFHEVRSDYEPPERKALRLHKKALEYKLANLDEGAVDYLLREIRAYKIRFDRHGNVRITKRETNHLKEHFNNSVSLLRAYRNANDVASVKQECMKLRYMSEILLKYYIRPNNHSDEMKELINLRSTILNALNTNLKWVKQKDPKYNFAEEYDRSKYGSDINLPRNVIRDATKTIVTLLV